MECLVLVYAVLILVLFRMNRDTFKLDMIPTCYLASEEIILMENLVTKGFTSIPKIEKVELDRTM